MTGTSSVITGLVNGHDYAVRLQPVRGWWPAEDDVRSNLVVVRPRPRS